MALINTLRQKAGKIVVGFVAFSMFSFILTDLFKEILLMAALTRSVKSILTITYPQFNKKVDELSKFSIKYWQKPTIRRFGTNQTTGMATIHY